MPLWKSPRLAVLAAVFGLLWPSRARACIDHADCVSGTEGACELPRCFGGACTTLIRPAGTVCRASAGPCDVADTCNGTDVNCPLDSLQPAGAVCRAATDACDAAEVCSGSTTTCPADALRPAGAVCRAVLGVCDVAETCNGSSAACPADARVLAGTLCRAATAACEGDAFCDGVSEACPMNPYLTSDTLCRETNGDCDVAEYCSGMSRNCPGDAFVPADLGVVCRLAAHPCDATETCDGASADCPADQAAPDGTACDDGSDCTTDACMSGVCVGTGTCTADAGPPDASLTADASALADAGAVADATNAPATDGGCDCRVGTGDVSSTSLWWAAVVVAVALGRRVRRGTSVVLLLLALVPAACGDDRGGMPDAGGPPDPYEPPPEGAPPCELSVDCPAGTHCDLGECAQACHRLDLCADEETACSGRGRCILAGTVDQDPEPPADNAAELVTPGDLVVAESADSIVLTLAATPADVTIRYRLAPSVPWLSVVEPRGEFQGAAAVTVDVDRDTLAPGVHTGTIVVHTSVGNTVIAITLTNGVTAVYEGALTYTTPTALGTLPLRLEVSEAGGQATLWIDPAGSPSFALGQAMTTTAFVGSYTDGTLTGTLVQRFDEDALGGPATFWGSSSADDPTGIPANYVWFGDREFGRSFSLELQSTPIGGLQGAFRESWVGILPGAIEVEGTLVLQRQLDRTPATITAAAPPTLPASPLADEPLDLSGLYYGAGASCSSAATTAGGYPAGYCVETAPASQLVSCGNALRTAGYTLESPTSGLLINDGLRGYIAFTNACSADLAASDRIRAYATPQDCFWLGNQICSQRLLGLAADLLPSDARLSLNREAADFAGGALLLLNDALVRAFQAPYKSPLGDSAVTDEMLADLAAGRGRARYLMRYVFRNVHLLHELERTPSTTAQLLGFLAPRRIAQLLDRYQLATLEALWLRQHIKGEALSTLREEFRQELLAELMALVTLGKILDSQVVPSGGSVALATDALTRMGARHRELQDGAEPFGIPRGFIPFIYDPSSVTPDRNTNFQFVMENAWTVVNEASAAEALARDALRDYDVSQSELAAELDAITNTQNQRLVELCGPLAGSPALPDLTGCEENPGGLLAQALSEEQESKEGLRLALTNIEVQNLRVELHRQRMIEIHQIRAETIHFVNQVNEEIDQLMQHQSWFDGFMSFATFVVGVVSSNPLAAAQGALGFIGGFVTEAIDRSIRDLQNAKELRLLASEADVEYINLMTELKELEIQFLQLGVEMSLAAQRVVTAKLRVSQIKGMVQSVQAEAELQAEQRLGSLANDPTVRIIRDQAVTRAIMLRDEARRQGYLAAVALEYELNLSFRYADSVLGSLRIGSMGPPAAPGLRDVLVCMDGWFNGFRTSFGGPQAYVDEISLREDVFGIHGAVTDSVTGQTLSPAEQFRRRLLQPTHLGRGDVVVGLGFTTSVGEDNPIFSPDVCNDQIRSIQAKLIGDGLGDDQATIILEQGGATFLRGCESYREGNGDIVRDYHIVPDRAVVYAGVNSYPSSPADIQFFGRAVAASDWTLGLPPGQRNADVDFTRIEDIVLKIEHSAYSLSTGLDYAPTCSLP